MYQKNMKCFYYLTYRIFYLIVIIIIMRVFITFCFFLFYFFFLKTEGCAYYNESFNIKPENWIVNMNDGGVYFNNGIGEILGGQYNLYPYLHPKTIIFPEDNYSLQIKFKFTGNYNYGAGIAFTDFLIQNDRSTEQTWEELIFFIWPVAQKNTFIFYSVPCLKTENACTNDGAVVFEESFGVWHDLTIIKKDSIYSFYLNGFYVNETVFTDRNVDWLWIGNPERTNSVLFPTLEIDEVKIKDLSLSPKKTPIILLPGLGASWDFEAVLTGKIGSNWIIPNFISTYQNFEDSLINTGYEKNIDFFIFTYDWRKNLNDLDDDLNSYIDNLISQEMIQAEEKINFVGHSMGGLVVRSYAQNIGQEKINKIITLGSPHKGTTDTYTIWEGATVLNRPWWQKIAIELLVELNQLPGETQISTLRRLAPGIKDLLPTYEFLLLEEAFVPWSSMGQKNDYLNSSSDTSFIDTLTKSFGGNSFDTKEGIKVVEGNWKDRLLEKWEDGKPISGGSFTYTTGDGTVLLSSAKGSFTQTTSLSTDHQGLIDEEESLLQIFNELGLDQTMVVTETIADRRQNVLAVVLKSPGEIEVCQNNICNHDLGIYLPESKLFFLPGYDGEEVEIGVKEEGLGNYDLHIGKIKGDESTWKRISGNLKESGQEDEYRVKEEGNDFVLEVNLQGRSQDFLIKATSLTSLVSWDDEGLVDRMNDSNTELKEKLRMARRIRWKLYLLIGKNKESDEFIEKTVVLWQSLDNLMEGLTFNQDFHFLLQCEYWKQVMERHQAEIEPEMFGASNYHSARLWSMGEERKEEVNLKDVLIPYSLLMDKINSAEYLFLTAKTIK